MEKLIKDGNVAVIVSTGFGAGWSSWSYGEERLRMMFDPVTAQKILDGTLTDADLSEAFPDVSSLKRASDLAVAWVPVGTLFRITEYDGSEDVEVLDIDNFIMA